MVKHMRTVKTAFLGGLSALLMNSCHVPYQGTKTYPYSGSENPFQGTWDGPYFVYGYPTKESRHRGLLKVRISDGYVSGEIYYHGKEGKLEGAVDEDGDFSTIINFDYGLFSATSDLDGSMSLENFTSMKHSSSMIDGEFTLSINGSSYNGNFALLPSRRPEKKRRELEKHLTLIHSRPVTEQ